VKKPKVSSVAEEALRKIEEAKAKAAADALAAEEAAKKAKTAELEKFWKAVREDPGDFTGWTYLLQHVDSKNDLEAGREAFAKFLQRYPYCYGYWKKYSDFEKRNGDTVRTMDVFEQGLKAIPLSVDLWIHFLNHQRAIAAADEMESGGSGNLHVVRQSYERAVTECGREWRSDKLWDHYVKWETEAGEVARVYQLYQRILKVPTQGAAHNLELAEALVKANSPKDLLPTDKFLALRKEVLERGSLTGTLPSAAEAIPGEDDATAMASEEENEAIRAKMVIELKAIYSETEARSKLRWKYEEGIKRPYFHVKPLERGQLKNWQDYLDFMKVEMAKEGGDLTEVEIIYERCLIACALYEEFWMDYVSWWESRKDLEEADRCARIRGIFERAGHKHLPTKVDLHTRWAAWEEKVGESGEASRILQQLELAHPGLVNVLLKRVNLERRRGRIEEACKLYEAAIAAAKTATASDLAVKYSRFLRLSLNDGVKAGEVLQAAVDAESSNPKLYLQQLDLILHTAPLNVQNVTDLLDKAMKAEGLSDKHKLLFAQRKAEFLQDFGEDVSALEAAEKEVEKMLKKMPGLDKSKEESRSITTIQGRGGKEKTPDSNGAQGNTSYPPTANSAQYGASQNAAWQQHGSRYSGYPGSAGQGNYGQWGYPGSGGYPPSSS